MPQRMFIPGICFGDDKDAGHQPHPLGKHPTHSCTVLVKWTLPTYLCKMKCLFCSAVLSVSTPLVKKNDCSIVARYRCFVNI